MDKRKSAPGIALFVILIVILIGRSHSPWVSIAGGIGLIACGIGAGLPYWKENKKFLAISLSVAGVVVGIASLLLR